MVILCYAIYASGCVGLVEGSHRCVSIVESFGELNLSYDSLLSIGQRVTMTMVVVYGGQAEIGRIVGKWWLAICMVT